MIYFSNSERVSTKFIYFTDSLSFGGLKIEKNLSMYFTLFIYNTTNNLPATNIS